MCLFRIKENDFIAKSAKDKDLKRVALNKAKAKAIDKRNLTVGYVLALSILVVPPIITEISGRVCLPFLIICAVIFWLLLTAVILLVLHFAFPRAVRKTYEEQLFELKILIDHIKK